MKLKSLFGHIPSHLFDTEIPISRTEINSVFEALPSVAETETVVLERIHPRARALYALHKSTAGGDTTALTLFWLLVKEEMTTKLPDGKTLEVRNNGSVVMVDVQ